MIQVGNPKASDYLSSITFGQTHLVLSRCNDPPSWLSLLRTARRPRSCCLPVLDIPSQTQDMLAALDGTVGRKSFTFVGALYVFRVELMAVSVWRRCCFWMVSPVAPRPL
jgi:hypothetical protein